jgi:hypothetical protein
MFIQNNSGLQFKFGIMNIKTLENNIEYQTDVIEIPSENLART